MIRLGYFRDTWVLVDDEAREYLELNPRVPRVFDRARELAFALSLDPNLKVAGKWRPI